MDPFEAALGQEEEKTLSPPLTGACAPNKGVVVDQLSLCPSQISQGCEHACQARDRFSNERQQEA